MSRLLREPFRILFVIGFLAAIAGVGIWPLYHWGIHGWYSGVMHARLQIEGFLGCFVAGFLLTAIPRMLEVRPCTKIELAAVIFLMACCLAAHIARSPLLGDAAFLGVILFLIFFAVRRFSSRKDLPPPYFILIPAGFLHALTGLALLLLVEMGRGTLETLAIGKNFLNIGFVLCLVLGIGSFLGPRFFGFLEGMPVIESRTPPPGWWTKAVVFLAAGLGIYLSFWMELGSLKRWAEAFRAAIATVILVTQARIFRPLPAPGLLPQAMRLAMILTLIGLWIIPIWPAYRVAALHVLFIGGFSLMTFIVSTRVSLGHSGFEHLFQKRLAFTGVLALLLTAAMVLRGMADTQPEQYFRILSLGSLLWLAGAVLWACVIMPKLVCPRPETE
jgi:uncharacterized protein involved in response to NO